MFGVFLPQSTQWFNKKKKVIKSAKSAKQGLMKLCGLNFFLNNLYQKKT